jgi:hypothetical protein
VSNVPQVPDLKSITKAAVKSIVFDVPHKSSAKDSLQLFQSLLL